MLNNWDAVTKAMDNMADSAGSANDEMSIIQESINYKLNALKQTWVGIVQDLLDRGTIGKIIDALTKISEVISKIVTNGGALSTIIGAIAGGVVSKKYNTGLFGTKQDISGNSLFSFIGKTSEDRAIAKLTNDQILGLKQYNTVVATCGKNSQDAVRIFNNFNKTQQTVAKNIDGSSDKLDKLSTGFIKVKESGNNVASTFKNIGATIGNMLISAGISLAIQSVISLFDQLINTTEYATAHVKEVFATYSTEASSIDSYKEKIATLQDKLKDNNLSYDEAKTTRKELMSIQDELFKKYGKEAEDIDIITDAINNQSEALDRLKEKKWRAFTEDVNASGDHPISEYVARKEMGASSNLERIEREMHGAISKVSGSLLLSNEDKELIKELENVFGNRVKKYSVFGGFTGIQAAGENLEDLLETYRRISDYLTMKGASTEFLQSINDTVKSLSDLYEVDKQIDDERILNDVILRNSAYKKALEDVQKDYDTYNKKLTDDGAEAAEGLRNKLVEKLSNLGDDINDSSVVEYIQGLYPDIEAELNSWKFKIALDVDTEKLKGDQNLSGTEKTEYDLYSKAKVFSNDIWNSAAVFTPVFYDENGVRQELTSDKLYDYAQGVLSEVREDDLHLMINTDVFIGGEAEQQAEKYLQKIQDKFDGVDFSKNELTQGLVANIKQFSNEEELLYMKSTEYAAAASESQQNAWTKINEAAQEYDVTVEGIIAALRELGMLDDFSYGDNNNLFEKYAQHDDSIRKRTRRDGTVKYDRTSQKEFDAALDSLDKDQYSTVQSFGDEQWEKISNRVAEVKEETDQTELTQEQYNECIVKTIDEWNKTEAAIREAEQAEKDLATQLEELGISDDEFNKYVEVLKALNPELALNEKHLQDIAVANIKLSQSASDLQSNLDSYKETLSTANKDSKEYSDAINALAKDLAGLTGVDFNILDAKRFSESAESMQLLENALNGDNDALKELQNRADQGIYIDVQSNFDSTEVQSQITALYESLKDKDIVVNANLDSSTFSAQLNDFVTWLDSVDPSLVGEAELEAQPFYNTLKAILEAGGKTADDLVSIFDAIGEWTVGWEPKQLKIPSIISTGITGATGDERKKVNTVWGPNGSVQVNWDYIEIPDHIKFTRNGGNTKPTTTIQPPPSSSSSSKGSGGKGGGGGSGSGSDPAKDAADAAEEAVDDIANEILQAALDSINEIAKRWENIIYLMEDQINDIQFAIDKSLNEKEIAVLKGESVKGIWKDILGNKKLLSDSYSQLAGGYSAQAAEMQAELDRQIAAGVIGANSSEAQDITKQIMDLQNKSQDAILDAQKAQIDYLKMYEERRGNIITAIQNIVNKFKNTIERFSKVTDKAWKFASKNFFIDKQIKASDRQIGLQRQLRKRYGTEARKTADTIGMRRAREIQNGTWDPTKETDGYIIEQGLKYQELRDKIQECADAISDLYDEQRKLVEQKVDAIIEQYDTLASYLESFAARIDAAIGLKNAKGGYTSIADLVEQYATRSDLTTNAEEELQSLMDNKDKIIQEHHDITQAEIEDSENAYKDTKKFKDLTRKKERLEEKKENNKLGKKGEKRLFEIDNQLSSIQENYVREGSISARQLAKAQKVVDRLGNKEYDSLSKKQKRLLDQAREYLKIAEEERAAEEERLDILRENDEKFDNDYDQKIVDAETDIDNKQAEEWEFLKQIAESQLTELKRIQENINSIVNNFKSLIDIVKDYDPRMLEDLGVLDYLGLDSSSNMTDILSQYYQGAMDSATKAVINRIAIGNVYQQLIEGAKNKDFTGVLEYAESTGLLTDEQINHLKEGIAELEANGYEGSSWIDEWNQGLAESNNLLKSEIDTAQALKDGFRENVLFAETTKAINELERLKKVLTSMESVLPSQWDTDVNGITEVGKAHINEYQEEMKASQEEANMWAQRLAEIDAAQEDYEKYGYKSYEEWQNARTEAIQNYYTAIQNGEAAAQKIYELGYKARQAEVNQLKRLVDARKQALAARKEYDDYSRKHKDTQKAVDEIQAQIDALNGVIFLPILFELREYP